MLLGLLLVMRGDLLQRWQQQLPPESPNYFLLNMTGDTQSFSATVSSLRKVDWESLRPNFFFIFPPGGMDGQPQTWLTSFRYHDNEQWVTQLTRQFLR